MINPTKITRFKSTTAQLEEVLLFWICAAGKNAMTSARGLEGLLSSLEGSSPFEKIRNYKGNLPALLKKNGIGCFNNKAKAFKDLISREFNLQTCPLEDLESVYGIGPKTARCFLMHSRKDARVAGLDTHVLRYMGMQGIKVPKSTPTGKKYRELELKFLELVDKSGQSVAEFDLWIWNTMSGKVVA